MHNIKHLRKSFSDENILNLVLRKSFYPYNYMDSFEKFKERQLPPKEAFYNRLKEEHISDDDYEHVKNVWSALHMDLHNF